MWRTLTLNLESHPSDSQRFGEGNYGFWILEEQGEVGGWVVGSWRADPRDHATVRFLVIHSDSGVRYFYIRIKHNIAHFVAP
jgi:hypothetical protein